MNLKLRFTVWFSLFIAAILIAFSIAIYGIANARRRIDFSDQLRAHLPVYEKAGAARFGDSAVTPAITGPVVNPKATIIDQKGMVLYAYPAGERYIPGPAILEKIRSAKEYIWEADDGNEYLGLVNNATQHVLISGGYDDAGLGRQSDLIPALVVLVTVGILFAALCSFFFSQTFFAPFRRLAKSMQGIYLRHHSEKLPVSTQQDIANDMARSVNGMLDRINQLSEFQKTFVFHASHEFRTPLATMLSETESALSKDLSEAEYKQVLLSLKEEQQNLIELTSSLLLLSLSDDNAFTKGWSLLRIDEVLYDTISRAGKFFPRLEVNMNFASVPDNPDDFLVKAEESLLRSAFLNILKNGSMYSIDNKVDVLIEFVGNTILVHFDNRGTQLPADEKPHITEPFFRGSNALKTKGYGLGLSVVNRIVLLMKGRLQYTAVGNDVNRFSITLSKAVP
ncbi:HAMP domain-containing sensor histidine kinase [Sediminibacterium soli]|uniref:HAMP domain-containing sensor histidine kinase n=1 Tax=Sediminibacterium soli TaxID=2698829 RepID=UPI00137B7957|nr:HAMP domain-containing sensor histidine kinase [Sediminibacterium soli]NCI48125.1 HAMP domain-containing histidine kinase [Sediminibacterium soli]